MAPVNVPRVYSSILGSNVKLTMAPRFQALASVIRRLSKLEKLSSELGENGKGAWSSSSFSTSVPCKVIYEEITTLSIRYLSPSDVSDPPSHPYILFTLLE
jgi:hypothetical protein